MSRRPIVISPPTPDDLRRAAVIVAVEPPNGRCCARCRRGTPAHGEVVVCGYSGNCPSDCHRKATR